MFEPIQYFVKDIQGDYAILVNDKAEEKPVALFLLPPNVDIGNHILYENMEYTILD